MKYLCHDIFMVRVPSLPVKIFRDFHKTNGNISDYISENEDVMNFMKESVLLSSKSLYNSLNNPPTEKKKIKNYKLGLLKYFTRASTRPTPYGLFAGVGLGSFSDKTKIIVDENKFKRDIKVDTYWICHVIHDLESDMKIASQLKLKFNPICFISGDRVKNPYFSNHGDINKYDDYVKENSIRYTPLIKLIKEKSQDFTSFQDIKKEILKVYTNAPDELLNNTLMQLIENEYLITELRLPAYCDDAMGYIIKILQDKSGVEELLNKLQGINKSIALYRNSNERLDRIKILEDIYKNMSEMYKSKNYLEVNKGLMLHENYLSDKIKEKLEKFVQTLSMIPLDSNDYCILDKFKEEFTERYGLNIEVPLVDIIDDNDFNGLNLLSDESYKLSQRESEIRKIIDNKILLALMNGEEEVNF